MAKKKQKSKGLSAKEAEALLISKRDTILQADIINIIKKADAGKPLTQAQRATVLQYGNSETALTTGDPYAKNKADLARKCSVSRQTIDKYCRRKDTPAKQANGSYDVGLWLKYLQGSGVIEDPEAQLDEKRKLDIDKLRLQCEQLAMDIRRKSGELIPSDEVEREVKALGTAIKNDLLALPAALAPRITGKPMDKVAQILRDGIISSLRHLSS